MASRWYLSDCQEVTRQECGPLLASEETVSGAPQGLETSRFELSPRFDQIDHFRRGDRPTQTSV